MAICRGCGTDIPDGVEYCEECLNKLNTAKDSESYLDSLLNAVMTEEPERREIVYSKREASSLVSVSEDTESAVDFLMEDLPAEEVLTADLFMEEPSAEEGLKEESFMEKSFMEESSVDDFLKEEPPMEDVFGMFFEGNTELPDLKNYSIFGDVDESTVDRMLEEDLGESMDWDTDAASEADKGWQAVEEDVSPSEVGDIEDLFGMLEDARGADAPEEIELTEPNVITPEELDAAADTFSGIVEAQDEEVPLTEFGDFADLFGAAEESGANEEPVTEFGDFADLFAGGEEMPMGEESEPATGASEQAMDDFADLFAGFDGDDSGLFEFGTEPIEMEAATEEPEAEEVQISQVTANSEQKEAATEPAGKKSKSHKKEKGSGRLAALYHKLFDNVKVDPSKIKPQPTMEELEAQKKAKLEAKERSKEEKEALLAEKKEQDKQVKLEKQRVKKEAKAEKKAKKMEEAKLLLEELEKTRINRAGASIVFIFFAMIAVVIIVGTSIFSYSLSMRNAAYEFERDEYTLAYNEIYGLEIKNKQEDILLYDRIMTVMYVQKQLNSYQNYYGMNDNPKALDSLLKGLQRYEKYIDLAVKLDVDSDLDSVRKTILQKIEESFSMTEQEAMEIIQSDSQAEYSKKVYDAVDALE